MLIYLNFVQKNVPCLEFWKITKYAIFGKNQAQLCSKFQYHIEWKYIKDLKWLQIYNNFLNYTNKNKKNSGTGCFFCHFFKQLLENDMQKNANLLEKLHKKPTTDGY